MEGVGVQVLALSDLPAARAEAERSGKRVSVSHSGELAAIATASVPVGIDIERINRARPWQRLGERCGWEVQSAEDFYERWTLYEAYAKARGLGLALDPRDVELEAWRVERLEVPSGYAGCLVSARTRRGHATAERASPSGGACP